MRQYKANLNPLLSIDLSEREDSVTLLSAYLEFRVRFSNWVKSVSALNAAMQEGSIASKTLEVLRGEAQNAAAWTIGATSDFQAAWEDSEAADLAGTAFYRIADWHDALEKAFSEHSSIATEFDANEQLSEVSANLHQAIYERLGFGAARDTD
ncbi:hypothetical protein ACFRFU_13565 [Streptomyces sp. NPDC056704]|uniref:hypothetical protein n=1 Tax=Streptomyces sp. NPDC056704 TaxID=3345917 RepID=UPI0036CA61A7